MFLPLVIVVVVVSALRIRGDRGGLRQYQSKNKVSGQRSDFAQRKGKFPISEYGNVEWRGATWILPWMRVSGRC